MMSIQLDGQRPFTVLISNDEDAPIEVFDEDSAMRAAVVTKASVARLSGAWDTAGVYVLLDRPAPDGTWSVYVGKSPAGMRARVFNHVKGRESWERAILITKDTTLGLNSTQVGWAERRFYDLFNEAPAVKMYNSVRPSEERLPDYDQPSLERLVQPVLRLLHLLGYTTDIEKKPAPASKKKSPKGSAKSASSARTRRSFPVKVSDLVTAGLLEVGTELISTHPDYPTPARVSEGGLVAVNGSTYRSPSSAASSIVGGNVNGWTHWAAQTSSGLVVLASMRAQCLTVAAS